MLDILCFMKIGNEVEILSESCIVQAEEEVSSDNSVPSISVIVMKVFR